MMRVVTSDFIVTVVGRSDAGKERPSASDLFVLIVLIVLILMKRSRAGPVMHSALRFVCVTPDPPTCGTSTRRATNRQTFDTMGCGRSVRARIA